MTPPPFAQKIWEMKQRFHRFETQEKTQKNSIISLNEAHITLKRRFYLKDPSLESEFLKNLATISFTPIQVHIQTTEIFASETMNNVLVANVSDKTRLTTLHQEILQSIFPYTTPESLAETHAFNPHISLIYDLANQDIDAAKKYADENLFPMEFELNEFMVLRSIEGTPKERVILSTIQA